MPLPAALEGRTFGDAWRSFDCTVIGYIRATRGATPGEREHSVRISPPDSDALRAGDKIVVIAHDIKAASQLRGWSAEARRGESVPCFRGSARRRGGWAFA